MLKTKNWIYLDLEKTGCTFLRNKFFKIYSENFFEETGKHSLQESRLRIPKIITIREPESYYFSLWSYGIDKKGGFFNLLKNFYPEKLNIFYGNKSKDCFSYFLDYVLNYPFRYPKSNFTKNDLRNYFIHKLNNNLNFFFKNFSHYLDKYKIKNNDDLIPNSCDVYTTRILSMLIPRSEENIFYKKLKTDMSYENLKKNLVDYLPEVILRTSSLNSDFYSYFNKGKLDFLDLPEGWQNIFPMSSKPINISGLSSSKTSDSDIKNYLTSYHKDLIKTKSKLSIFLLDKAKELLGE